MKNEKDGLDAQELRIECHGIGRIHKTDSSFNATTLKNQCRSIEKNNKTRNLGSVVNAAAFTTQCRGMRGQLKIHAIDRILNAVALSIGCRSIGPEAEKKFKSLIFIRLLMYVGF